MDRRTGRERVGEVLRERILAGELAPGERIDLDKYAAEFGTSRTPVREACLALAQDGLVKVVQRSGVTVIGVSPESTIENFQLMAALSGVAAQWAAGKISERDLLRVKELQREIGSPPSPARTSPPSTGSFTPPSTAPADHRA